MTAAVHNPGKITVYSCKEPGVKKGDITESWLEANRVPILDRPLLPVYANRASVGKVFTRRSRCTVTDDVIVVEILSPCIDLDYAASALLRANAAGRFLYEAKLFQARLEHLTIDVPALGDGKPDMERERRIASAIKRFDAIFEGLADLGKLSDAARIV